MIRAPEVRLIDVDGSQIGIMSAAEALRLAESKGLDLVEVAAAARPPVCRITDFDKYRYAQKKKAQISRRHVTASTVKEVKVRARTEKHDIDFKVRHIRRFVAEGQRVKVSVWFRGREITHPELGKAILDQIIQEVQDVAQPEGAPRMEGRNMSILLTRRS